MTNKEYVHLKKLFPFDGGESEIKRMMIEEKMIILVFHAV